MQWDDVNGPRSFFGNAPVDIDKPIAIGEIAKLRVNRKEIKVKIIDFLSEIIKGEIIDASVGIGLVTGDIVEFKSQNIVTLYRN
ncbi:hypothetical protein [uncultured Photobacterium sp.]|uniref:hypothetical protein n=1 Tax=uncultured Photobacterium sp. TaxID=173973 RepID=UPI00260F36ED|nr:hypothetical protein [uncultured Photobacterium sp.]